MDKILILIGYFHPAYKAGGPVKTALGLVEALSESFEIDVIAEARDLGEKEMLKGIIPDRWNVFDKYRVFFASNVGFWKHLLSIRIEEYSCLYFNSLFSFKYTIAPLLYWKILSVIKGKTVYIVLAPRGQLAGSALQNRSLKKRVTLFLLKKLLTRNVRYHVTSAHEYADVIEKLNVLPGNITEVTNLRPLSEFRRHSFRHITKEKSSTLRLVTVTRIVALKNIDFSLDVLSKTSFPIQFDIYGTIEDSDYWDLCLAKIRALPDNVVVNYLGAIKPDDVVATLQQYHILFHPSKGENFGHTILESFVAGRPALISDQTYWLGLEKVNAGWDLELKLENFCEVLSFVNNMTDEDFYDWCIGAYKKAEKYFYNSELIAIYQHMFKYKL